MTTQRYTPRANPPKGTPTKEDHDAWVEEHGVPFTHQWMRHLDPPRRPAKRENT